MAIVAGTYVTQNTTATNSVVGQREDLSDIIHNIAPTDTPFWQMIAQESAEAIYHEWQTDTLAAAAANAQVEGDEATFANPTPTVRLGNRTQISRKTVVVSATTDAVNKAGRGEELPYQIEKLGKELKRDIELGLTQNSPITTGNSTTARTSGGFETWILTNTSLATVGTAGVVTANTGGQPDNTAQPTDGTQRAFTEDLLETVVQAAWTQGGQPMYLMTGPFNKRVVSGFTGNATRTIDAGGKRLQSAIDVYAHDFGELTVIPNRFSRDRTALVIDPEYWAIAWLRPIGLEDLAKTGDAEKRMLVGEWTLVAKQEKASGKVADLTTS